jgi:enoyl-CoA hydratase/carnithine racemase
MNDEGDFQLELRGHVAVLTLDRVAKRNALTPVTLPNSSASPTKCA